MNILKKEKKEVKTEGGVIGEQTVFCLSDMHATRTFALFDHRSPKHLHTHNAHLQRFITDVRHTLVTHAHNIPLCVFQFSAQETERVLWAKSAANQEVQVPGCLLRYARTRTARTRTFFSLSLFSHKNTHAHTALTSVHAFCIRCHESWWGERSFRARSIQRVGRCDNCTDTERRVTTHTHTHTHTHMT